MATAKELNECCTAIERLEKDEKTLREKIGGEKELKDDDPAMLAAVVQALKKLRTQKKTLIESL